MGKNFLAMPLLLKLLTAVTLVVPAFCVTSLFPHQSIRVFGQLMTATEWWSSGAGFVTLVIAGLMLGAALLMLRRSRSGRLMYILALILTSFSAPLITYLVPTDTPGAMSSLFANLVLTVFVGTYLYKSRSAQNYFKNTQQRR